MTIHQLNLPLSTMSTYYIINEIFFTNAIKIFIFIYQPIDWLSLFIKLLFVRTPLD